MPPTTRKLTPRRLDALLDRVLITDRALRKQSSLARLEKHVAARQAVHAAIEAECDRLVTIMLRPHQSPTQSTP